MARPALLLAAAGLAGLAAAQNATCVGGKPVTSFAVTLLNGTKLDLTAWDGEVILLTNVASF